MPNDTIKDGSSEAAFSESPSNQAETYYVVIPSIPGVQDLALPIHHWLWGQWSSPLEHTPEEILAAYSPDKKIHSYLEAYTSLDVAKQSAWVEGENYLRPIYQVELDPSTLKETEVNATYQPEVDHLSPANSTKLKMETVNPWRISIVSAYHGTPFIEYKLKELWESRIQNEKDYEDALKELLIRRNSQPKDTPEGLNLKTKIEKLYLAITGMRGRVADKELTDLLQNTNALLNDPTLDKINQYKELAYMQQGAPSRVLQIIGVCMLALAIAVAALAFPTLGVSLAAAGFFAVTGLTTIAVASTTNSVCRAMDELVSDVPIAAAPTR